MARFTSICVAQAVSIPLDFECLIGSVRSPFGRHSEAGLDKLGHGLKWHTRLIGAHSLCGWPRNVFNAVVKQALSKTVAGYFNHNPLGDAPLTTVTIH